MDYSRQREDRRETAVRHTKEMADKYAAEISECIKNSVVYGGPDKAPVRAGNKAAPNYFFVNQDTASAARFSSGKKALLNFASFKHPGGGFIAGSKAQEEMLCHSSFLYNVLKEFEGFYDWNNCHTNRGLYKDRAIYTPGVVFDGTVCDVITCAAPNMSAGLKYGNVSADENRQILEKRIEFIRDIAEENGVEMLVLGAFGCGVFKQDPEEVAQAIKKAFAETSVKRIIIAVPGNDNNYRVFKREFGA